MTPSRSIQKLLVGAALFCALAPAAAQSTLPNALTLSAEPLLGVPLVHPNVALALSVEFPTVGAAFNRIRYTAGTKYTGYFNSGSCYLYNSSGEYFYPSGSTNSNYSCSGTKFSGNFLNWATMSSIDVFRYALTGGYRVVDTTTQTILARTFLPNGDSGQPSNFYAHNSYFARRWVSASETGNNDNIATVAPDTVTPFNPTRMSVVNCQDYVLFGAYGLTNSNGTRTCASTDNDDGRFPGESTSTLHKYRVRVLVCDATEGPNRGDLCGKYPNGGSPIYKPIGEMQKNADNMRFSVFGYLIDQTTQRYGGVMRAAMKYVGPNNYDATFRLSGTNTGAEWSATTGIFTVNPEAASEGNSGVVNYLNKFGNLSGYEGVYKQYDPVSELHYEALRYLQGKAPTSSATSGTVTDVMKQGFPVVTNWTDADPLKCSAQPQYIITIADTNAWGDKTIPGNTYTSQNDTARATDGTLDVLQWTRQVGLRAKVDGLLPLPGGGISSAQADTLDTWVSSRGNSFAMAGAAYWAATQDIRPDNNVAVNAGDQHVTTITIDVAEPSALLPTERQLFLAGAYGGADSPSNPNWMLASNPDALIAALQNAFSRVSSTSGSLGGGTISSGTYVAGETGVFVPYFNTATWYGELEKYAITVTDGVASIATTPSWKANDEIPAFDEATDADSRNIVLGSSLGGGVAFEWANLSSTQQSQLGTNPSTQQADSNGEERLKYLRGSRQYEGIDPTTFVGELPQGADGTATGTTKPFRVRTKLLGDIVNSSPVYVGKPAARISEALGPGYSAWSNASARQNRTRMVYVGANDGMLHGFNAETGAEVFAYIPSQMVPKLAKLTHPGYSHEPFVDGALASGDAYARNAWRTVLTGGYGGGARGVFALDVTNPSSFSGSNVLWEFSAADDADMGYVMGKPLIAPVRVTSNGTTSIKWFVVTASGYNNYGADGSGDNANGYVFLLSLDKAANSAWALNSNYYKIQIPLDASSTAAMGLAQPGGVYDYLGVLTNMYVGDLRGNLWRVDVNSGSPSNWGVAFSGSPLFVARDANDNRQPIAVAPVISHGPNGGYLVSFGTGRLLATGDTTARAVDAQTNAFDVQSFYSVWDNLGSSAISGRSQLAARSISNGAVSGTSFVYGTNSGQKRGWYFDFPAATSGGERMINSAVSFFGSLVFNTITPGADPCASGQSVTYTVSTLQGSGTTYESQVGYIAAPLILRTQVITGKKDPTMYRKDSLGLAIANVGTTGQSITNAPPTEQSTGSWTWRELVNWRELRRP
jgi:type IV pilus assembly protein PilY1